MSTPIRPRTTIVHDAMVTMRDGVSLATDIYRPDGASRYPAIVLRTPYGKAGATGLSDVLEYVRNGYAVAVQDSRGTGGSEGDFQPLRNEPQDGADAIAWAAAQPWSDGNVATMGPVLFRRYAARHGHRGPARPPDDLAVLAYTDEMLYQGGAWRLGNNLVWCLGMAGPQLARAEAAGHDVAEMRELLAAANAYVPAAFRHMPLLDHVTMTPWLNRALRDWISPPESEYHREARAMTRRFAQLDLPVLHVAGGHDVFLNGSLAAYQALRANATTQRARDNQRLIVLPCGHGPVGPVQGDLTTGRPRP